MRFFLKCFLLSLSIVLIGTSSLNAEDAPDKTTKFLWFLSPNEPAKGVVIVVHGLNNHPAVMDSLIQELNKAGLHALRVCLAGHCDDKPQNSVRRKDWKGDIAEAVRLAKEKYPMLPLFNLSYSLGSAVTVAYLREQPARVFSRMVFLAPAITLRTYCGLMRPLLPLRALHLAFPSVIPKEFRAHDWNAVRMYNELFRVVDANNKSKQSVPSLIVPTLSITHEDDELIDGKQIIPWAAKRNLTNWRSKILKSDTFPMSRRYHLLFAKDAVTPENWLSLNEAIVNFFAEPPPR